MFHKFCHNYFSIRIIFQCILDLKNNPTFFSFDNDFLIHFWRDLLLKQIGK